MHISHGFIATKLALVTRF